MRPSRLEYLHIALAELFTNTDLEDTVLDAQGANSKIAEAMTRIDVTELVSGLAAAGPCLRIVVVTLATRGQSVWTVTRGDGKPQVRRLDAYSGRQVIDREEWRSTP